VEHAVHHRGLTLSFTAARLERRAEVDEIVANWTCQFDKHILMRLVGSTAWPERCSIRARSPTIRP
jgi:hypothetical protein